jgi:glycerol-3-phosphate O-acyltransferase/dihydroxyacetone phosphate acyltransferase
MLWHILRYLTTFILPTFYKRIQGKNEKNLMVKGPVIIAMNHPNAFTDPVAFTYVSYPVRLKYLARGDAFKPGLISWMLEQLGIVPIFRIQDAGKEGLQKNDEAYRRVNALLKRNHKIIVFAEGLCIQERRLRPLKKGVARMVFGAYEFLKNDKLIVIPVGVNYSQPDKFRSDLFYNVGEPIYVKDFIEEYKVNPARAQNHFLHALEPKMKELITHINNKKYDDVVAYIETLCKKDWIIEQGLNPKSLADDYMVTKKITDKVNQAEMDHPEVLDEFKEKASRYFKELRKSGLRDWLLNPKQNEGVTQGGYYLRILAIILGSPLYLLGLIGNILPYKITKTLTKRLVKGNKEFYASISIGVGAFLILINYLLWFFLVYAFSPNIFLPLLVCLVFALCGWFTLYFHFFILKVRGVYRALKDEKTVKTLAAQRKELLSLINKF